MPAAAGPKAEALASASYRSGVLEGAEVTLCDGCYERGDGVAAWLLPAPLITADVAARVRPS